MPEGAQVHLVAIRHNEIFAKKTVDFESPDGRSSDLVAAFDGKRLRSVTAIGKHLLYSFGPDFQLHVHLGRFGKFRSGELPAPEATPGLRFRVRSRTHWLELRGATAIEHYDEDHAERLRERIGPDPLNGDDPSVAFERIRTRRTAIGALLMDQSIVAGVGNIYRAEMLFRAGISPMRSGSAVALDELHAMWTDVEDLMRYSLAHDGRIVSTKPRDRIHPKRARVARFDSFYVYGRAGKPCRHCGTSVESKAMAGRTVFYCPRCQPE